MYVSVEEPWRYDCSACGPDDGEHATRDSAVHSARVHLGYSHGGPPVKWLECWNCGELAASVRKRGVLALCDPCADPSLSEGRARAVSS